MWFWSIWCVMLWLLLVWCWFVMNTSWCISVEPQNVMNLLLIVFVSWLYCFIVSICERLVYWFSSGLCFRGWMERLWREIIFFLCPSCGHWVEGCFLFFVCWLKKFLLLWARLWCNGLMLLMMLINSWMWLEKCWICFGYLFMIIGLCLSVRFSIVMMLRN